MLWGPDQVGVRRIRTLIHELPPDSALRRKVDGGYSYEREMLATAIELLHIIASDKQIKVKDRRPFKAPRPWIRKPKRRRSLVDAMRGL